MSIREYYTPHYGYTATWLYSLVLNTAGRYQRLLVTLQIAVLTFNQLPTRRDVDTVRTVSCGLISLIYSHRITGTEM